MEDCAKTSELIQLTEEKHLEYKQIARKDCTAFGGINKISFCPNQKYLYTIKKTILNFNVCIDFYQCIGCFWECARKEGGYIE